MLPLLPYTRIRFDNCNGIPLLMSSLFFLADVGQERFDLVFATWWKTALELHRINAYQYAYFVQSIESRFYPESEPRCGNS